MGLFSGGKLRKEFEKKMEGYNSLFSVQGYFDQYGLPIEKQGVLGLVLQPDKVIIVSHEHEFILKLAQIKDVEYRVERETERELRTSVAKGIVGGALFGTVGAIIGSQPKQKTIKDITISSLTFSYVNSQNEASTIELVYKTVGDKITYKMEKFGKMVNEMLLKDKKPASKTVEL